MGVEGVRVSPNAKGVREYVKKEKRVGVKGVPRGAGIKKKTPKNPIKFKRRISSFFP